MFLLIGTILTTIWKYHFSSILENEVFDPRRVSSAIDIEIVSVLAQLAEKEKRQTALQTEEPPTHSDTNFPT